MSQNSGALIGGAIIILLAMFGQAVKYGQLKSEVQNLSSDVQDLSRDLRHLWRALMNYMGQQQGRR